MDRAPLTATLKSEAQRLGFKLAGVCPATPAAGWSRLQQWLAAGYGGEMHYLAKRLDAYAHPSSVLAGARSLLMLAFPYQGEEPAAAGIGEGCVSRYAWGPADYHDVIHARLQTLSELLRELVPGARARGVVDTAPLLEREFAQRAGLGWIGKHTLLIHPQAGSWFFLAGLLTDQELSYDEPFTSDHCGTCRRCLDACPTHAFPAPYVLDATRCISYLTIELRGPIPEELRSGIGNWVFGCDVCQDVCPWNRHVRPEDESPFAPAEGRNPLPLGELFRWDEAAFRAHFRQTPLWRPRRRGLLRNAAIVLGNQRHRAHVEPLTVGLQDEEALVRGACAWALGQIGGPKARHALQARLAVETEPEVHREITAALERPPPAAEGVTP